MSVHAILVLRKPDQFSDQLQSSGFRVINFPVTATRPVDDFGQLNDRIVDIDRYDGCFFTSPVAAEIFVKALIAADRTFTGKIYVLGERAKEVFEKVGIDVEFRSHANTAGEFIGAFPESEFAGKSYLFVKGEQSIGTVPDMLADTANVEEVVVYRTTGLLPETSLVDETRNELLSGRIKWVCFFAPSAVESFLRIFELSELSEIKTAAIGATTAGRIRDVGLPVNFISKEASSLRFAAGLIQHIKNIE